MTQKTDVEEDEHVRIPPVRVCLVAGVHRADTPCDWLYVSKAEGDKLTRCPLQAALFPFSREWIDVARGASIIMWRKLLRGDWEHFVARVCVAGDDLENPSEVTPCWKLEGLSEPQDQSYFWEETRASVP
jgi:hypothetical protein